MPCPATTLDRLSSKDVIGPALVLLEPPSNTAIRHAAISTLDLRFNEDDRDPAIVRMEVTVSSTGLRYPTMIRLETSTH